LQNQTLESAGTKIVPYVSLKDEKDLNQAIETLSYPFIVKTRFGGYDGKGQILVKNDSNIEEAKALVSKHECVAEKFLDLDREVSLTVTIGNQNQIA
jgi:5-(carboxyamino)imidazole ribonucleotide synthase